MDRKEVKQVHKYLHRTIMLRILTGGMFVLRVNRCSNKVAEVLKFTSSNAALKTLFMFIIKTFVLSV